MTPCDPASHVMLLSVLGFLMQRLLVKWVLMATAILAIPHLVGGVRVESFAVALAVAAVLAVLNVVLKPILILLTLPLTVLTLGFFLLVLNAFMVQIAPFLVSGFYVDSFGAAFLASLIISVVSWLANIFDDGRPRWRISSGRRHVGSPIRINNSDHGSM